MFDEQPETSGRIAIEEYQKLQKRHEETLESNIQLLERNKHLEEQLEIALRINDGLRDRLKTRRRY